MLKREGEREKESRFRVGPEIRRGAIDFGSGNDQYAGRRGEAESERGGGKSIHCFGETRRARVPAHRPANGASFGGSMRHCVLPRRLRLLCFHPSPLSVSPSLFSSSLVYFICSSSLYTFCSFACSLTTIFPHPRARRSRARNDSRRPRPNCICDASSRCKYPWNFR